MKDKNTGTNTNTSENQSQEIKKRKSYPEEVYRVVISKDSNDNLEQLAAKVSDGYPAGEISKSDVANYIFSALDKFISEADIKLLRSLYFDEKKVLATMLRRSVQDDELPEVIKRAVREHHGLLDREKKRAPKPVVGGNDEAA